jgi:hypothetical protein
MKNRIKVIIAILLLTTIYCFTTAILTKDLVIVMFGWCISFVTTVCCALADTSNDPENNWFNKTKLW